MEDDEELDAVHFRLDSLGYRVGQGLVERYVCLFSLPSDYILGLSWESESETGLVWSSKG